MGPRAILYTGKGGVGKTSVAAAGARRIAATGARTLVLSTDPAHSLADVLQVGLGSEPTPLGGGLWGQQVHAQDELERHWGAVRDRLGAVLVEPGVDRISAQELAVAPGLDELFSLLELRHHAESGEFDCIVVDCAPTAETLRLLSLPDVARWWLHRVFAQRGRVSRPGDRLLDDAGGLARSLIAMNEILRDGDRVSLRLVMSPDRVVIDEARRSFTYLNLYGLHTDAVVVNRIFPAEVGPYFDAWREQQQACLRDVRDAFSPIPVLCAPFFEQEVRGDAMLDRLGDAVFAGHDASAVLHHSVAERLVVGLDEASLRLELPFARKDDITVQKVGLELVVGVDGHRRTLLLPPALGDYRPRGAELADGALTVTFDGPSR